jgi:hypothetical protein
MDYKLGMNAKTCIAVLRATLCRTVKSRDRKGREVVKSVPWTQQEFADCAGWTVFLQSSLETGRAQLTPANAELLGHVMGVSVAWLLAGDPSKPPVDSRGRPFTAATFEARQRELAQQKPESDNDLRRLRRAFTERVAQVAAVLLRGLETGQSEHYDHQLRLALRKIYFRQGEEPLWPAPVITAAWNGRPTLTRPDLAPVLDYWEEGVRKLSPQRKATRPRRRTA